MNENASLREKVLPRPMGSLRAKVMDGEGDFFKVSFKYDNCATIDGDGMTYSCFESQTLIALGELVLFADDWYKKNLE